MKRKILSMLFVLSMLCVFAPIIANAASNGTCGANGDNLTWALDDEGTLTISGEGNMKDYQYSSFFPWYNNRFEIQTVIIEDGVTNISNSAFQDYRSLKKIIISDSVTIIGDSAFGQCSSLTTITIPDGVTSIGDYAFRWCSSLTDVTIGSNLTSIGTLAFDCCGNLTNIYVNSRNKNYCSVDGNVFNKDKTEIVLYAMGKTDKEYVILNGITNIKDHAFYNCDNLTSVIVNKETHIANVVAA